MAWDKLKLINENYKSDEETHRTASLSVSRLKKPSISTSPIKLAFASRPDTPHQSATDIPRVNKDYVSISTFKNRPENKLGFKR